MGRGLSDLQRKIIDELADELRPVDIHLRAMAVAAR